MYIVRWEIQSSWKQEETREQVIKPWDARKKGNIWPYSTFFMDGLQGLIKYKSVNLFESFAEISHLNINYNYAACISRVRHTRLIVSDV